MISVFAANATSFAGGGLGVLRPLIAEAHEEINGLHDITMELTVEDAALVDIGSIIVADTHRGRQPYRVVRVDKYSALTITVYAMHLSYDLAGDMIEDRAPTETTATGALIAALDGTAYSGTSDVPGTASARWVRKSRLAAIMGEEDNSVVNRWGGEVDRDGYGISVLQRLGADRGVEIRYRKNLTGLAASVDASQVVTRIYPTGLAEDGQTVVMLPEKYIDSPLAGAYPTVRSTHIHFGEIQVGDNYPTVDDVIQALRDAAAATYAMGADLPLISMDVQFVDLAQTQEYAQYATLERVYLGDTVRCYHAPLGVDVYLRAVSVTWDALRQRYTQITLGQPVHSIVQTIQAQAAAIPVLQEQQTLLQAMIDETTRLLNAPGASYIRFSPSISNPAEIYAMDSPDTAAALNVVRINSAGIGVSQTGIAGPYKSAIIGSGVLADAIVAGTIGAAVIFAGELYAAHGTITNLTAGDPVGAHMSWGVDENGDPYQRVYDDDNNLTRSILKDRDQIGAHVTLRTYTIGNRTGYGIFVG